MINWGNGDLRGSLLLLLSLLVFTGVVMGQSGQHDFEWTFEGNQTALTLCNSYKISVQSSTNTPSIGTPPFYMLAFTPGGVTTRSLLGSDPENLQWTVNQPAGSLLMLSVMDADGSAGGIPPFFFSVTPGPNDTCIPPQSSTKISITANVTQAETCQPVGFRVEGGTKPYNVSLAALNSPIVTIVTLGPDDDMFTFIDRADPHMVFVAAVADATGTWGTTSEIVRTNGSSNVDCPGLVSSSGRSSSGNRSSGKSNSTTIAVVVIIPIVVIILALVGGLWYKKRNGTKKLGPALLPEAWSEPMGMAEMGEGRNVGEGRVSLAPARGSEKSRSLARLFGGSREDGSPTQSPGAGSSDRRILIQHRDGGAIPVEEEAEVQEIPPPYIFDRNISESNVTRARGR